MMSTSFARTAGWCSLVAAAAVLAYSITIAVLSTLLGRAGAPRNLVRLGWITAGLLVWVWLGPLTALDPKEPWVAPAVVGSGFVGVPLWYGWVGWLLLHDRLTAATPATAPSVRPAALV